MNVLLLTCSVSFAIIIQYVTNIIRNKNQNHSNSKYRFLKLLQFVKFAPIIALLILSLLVLLYFHTKPGIRLSHAWFVAQYWAYTTFLYCSYRITKKNICLIAIAISLLIAVYYTPLFHFEKVFIGRYVPIADIFGTLMFIALWSAISKIAVKSKN